MNDTPGKIVDTRVDLPVGLHGHRVLRLGIYDDGGSGRLVLSCRDSVTDEGHGAIVLPAPLLPGLRAALAELEQGGAAEKSGAVRSGTARFPSAANVVPGSKNNRPRRRHD
jgi:hypothetical protein